MSARRLLFPAAFVVLASVPAFAQDPPAETQEAAAPQVVERVRSRAREDAAEPRAPRAPRADVRMGAPEARPRVRAEAPAAAAAAPAAPATDDDQAQGGRRRPSGGGGRGPGGGVQGGSPRGGRDAGGAEVRGGVRNPDIGDRGGRVATAVPRGQAPRAPYGTRGNWNRGSRQYFAGSGGLAYYYYDPWSWYGGWGWPALGAYGSYGAWNSWNGGWGWGGGWGNNWGGWGGASQWATGGVRIKVNARDAEVLVDGYYAGIVDDFDGTWQQLRLDDGGYRIEIRKPGFETLTFDVMVQPGRTITYRGVMQPVP